MTKHGSRFAALKSVSMALPVLVATAASEAGENDTGRSVRGTKTQVGKSDGRIGQHLTVDSPLRDLLAHPAFAGFAPLLLPWDNRTYDPNMPLHDLGSLLPYHSHVDPATSVKALNRMVDDIGQGKVVFYDFYSEAQKREQPARRYTGLFFFRGKPGASFAVIAPGGGFSYVGSVHEGFPYTVEINAQGKASPSADGLRDYESGELGFAAVGRCLPYALVRGKHTSERCCCRDTFSVCAYKQPSAN